ncbi:hypothetical protein DFH08DRAFT_1072657 [Mycena albidolilacea]|uniref:F-box domain-containing protein n=1 Tax=Mycena albidolilacea TaxID=1033008 RepID=A0AAD7ASW7_9AGAR|nr:hypothetical protein DFH08DRAFT_1072657 [Mycena albidolilacea]
MEIALGQLRALRASLKTPIDAHGVLISPMSSRHIPQDVLLAIFSSCLPSEHNAVIDPTEAPLLLGRICRHRRDTTYSTPMLWSSIHIPVLDLRAPPPLRRRLEGIVQAWLERSATCPLSVSFFDDNHYDESAPNPENHSIILQLLPISRRLRHRTLVGNTELLRPFLRLGPENTTSLFLFEDDEDHPLSTNALQLATLEDVTLQMSSATDPLTLPLRWSQLTQLRLESFPA